MPDWWPFSDGDEPADDGRVAEALAEAPLLWMFGKTGSGKSSIVRFLTGADDAEVGDGYRPQTRSSKQYDFPDSDAPLVRFLDTRSLAEVAYDPADDIRRFGERTHLIVLTVRSADQSLRDVVEPLRVIRRETPSRPVLLVLTALHELTPGEDFTRSGEIPAAAEPAIAKQQERFDGLFDRCVCVDLTPAEYGFADHEFGGDELKDAVLDLLPEAQKHAVAAAVLQKSGSPAAGHLDAKILAYSCAAASAAAVPVPWVDLPVVAGLQWHLTRLIAKSHGQSLDKTAVARMSTLLGGRAALAMGFRELAKFVPYLGSVLNASAAFGMTYAAGMAADYYFREVAGGHVPSDEEIRRVYDGQVQKAATLWQRTSDPKLEAAT